MGKEMRQNKELASYQANLQSQENQRQEQFNADEWTRQFGMQEQQWQQHFAQETEWNSEQAKARRLREVGVNPVAALGGSQSGVVATSSTGSPAVSPRSGVSSAPAPFASSTPQILNSLNESIANFGKVGLQEEEKNRISKLLSGEIQLQMQQLSNEREKGIAMQLANFFERENLPIKQQQSIANLYLTLAERSNKLAQAENFDKDSALKDLQSIMQDEMNKLQKQMSPLQFTQLKILVDNLPSIYASQIAVNRTTAQKNTAEAAQANENTRGLKLLNDINYENKHILVAQMQQEWTNMVNAGIITEQQAYQAGLTSSIMAYAESKKELDYWKGFIADVIKSGGDIVNAYANMKTAGAWQQLNENQKRNIDAKIYELRRHENDTNVRFYWDEKNGVFRPKEADANVPNVDNSWLQFGKK